MYKIVLGLAIIGLVSIYASYLENPLSVSDKTRFQQFCVDFGKNYGITEYQYRFEVFLQNLRQAEEWNQKEGKRIWGVTQFSDLTDEEFKETYLTLKVDKINTSGVKFPLQDVDKIDWVTNGAVTPVKNQGSCGSCWTFGSSGVLEGHFKITTGELPSLSEQQLVDCSTLYDLNFGCSGGMPSRALRYVTRFGLSTEEEYPYTAKQGTCQKQGGKYRVDGHIDIDPSEEGLIAALQKQPVSVGVDASRWKLYKPAEDVIFHGEEDNLNHAVLAVGFDKDSIKVKNSWASTWGDVGFIHLARRANTCGVWNTMIIPK